MSNAAKLFGGSPLQGSTKQKKWGEDIRADKLGAMSTEQAILACRKDGLGGHAKFWIENRDRTGDEFGRFFETQNKLLTLAKEARRQGLVERYEELARSYNSLTSEWGFR